MSVQDFYLKQDGLLHTVGFDGMTTSNDLKLSPNPQNVLTIKDPHMLGDVLDHTTIKVVYDDGTVA
jgi:hypothetical protein